MKSCRVCGEKHHLKGLCRGCYNKQYYYLNQEKILLQKKEYISRPETKEKKKQYNRSDKGREASKRYESKPEAKEKRRLKNKSKKFQDYLKKYRKENREKIRQYHQRPEVRERRKERDNKSEAKKRRKELRELPENKIKIKNYQQKYNKRDEVKKHRKECDRIYNQQKNVKERKNKLYREKWKSNILFNLECKMRMRIRAFYKIKNISKNNTTMQIVGCTPQKLREHIENQFTSDMTWDLLLSGDIEIDHIIPLSSAKTEEDVYRLCHYTNLQPLWKLTNRMKGDKLDWSKAEANA